MLKRNIIVAAAILVSHALVAHAQNAEPPKDPAQLHAGNALVDPAANRVADAAPGPVTSSRADFPQQPQSANPAVGKETSGPAGRAEAWDELSRIVNTGGTN